MQEPAGVGACLRSERSERSERERGRAGRVLGERNDVEPRLGMKHFGSEGPLVPSTDVLLVWIGLDWFGLVWLLGLVVWVGLDWAKGSKCFLAWTGLRSQGNRRVTVGHGGDSDEL